MLSTLLLLTMLVPTLASPANAQAAPERSIEIFYERDMVSIVGYESGSNAMIEVVRAGQVVGAVTRTVFPDGTYEINHTGAGANDCWGPGAENRDDPVDPQHPNVTPNIKPGDTVRTTILSGLYEGDVNTAVTRDVYLDLSENGLVADEGDPEVDGDGTITYQFTGIVEEDIEDVQTNGVAQSIEWTPAVVEPALPAELTVYDRSEGALPGCSPVEGAGPVEESIPNVNQDLASDANLSAPVEGGRTIEIVYGIEFVVLEGYPANRDVRVDVVRGQGENAVVVGSTTQRTDGTGLMEINHLGGGLFPGGDCWDYPGTPDIKLGDTVMATVLSPNGTPATDANGGPDVDTVVVRDVFLDTDNTVVNDPTPGAEGGATISLQGHVRDLPNGQVDEAADVLELRLNANGFDWQSGDRPGRKDMRAQVTNIEADGSFTHVFG